MRLGDACAHVVVLLLGDLGEAVPHDGGDAEEAAEDAEGEGDLAADGEAAGGGCGVSLGDLGA